MRADLEIIEKWIKPGSRVLDLGCGDGSLLAFLRDNKGTIGIGLEIDNNKIDACLNKGIDVIQQDMNKGLGNFETHSFDTVLLTQTLQAMHYPDLLVEEMLRIGKNCIVTFPNFGNWKSRAHIAFKGRMPVSDFMPYQWYDTPNIRVGTFKDFEVLATKNQLSLLDAFGLQDGREVRFLPNARAATAVFRFERG
jgi:methionine biosynthesis protein MetW